MAEGKGSAPGTAQRVVAFPEHVDVSNATQIGEELLTAFADGTAVVIADMSARRSSGWTTPFTRSATMSSGLGAQAVERPGDLVTLSMVGGFLHRTQVPARKDQ